MKIKTSRLNVRIYTFVARIVEIWNSLPESVIQAKTVKQFEIGLDEHWKHQECKYDLTANINIRCNSGSDVKLRINDVDLEADIVVTSQRPLVPMASYGFFRVLRFPPPIELINTI